MCGMPFGYYVPQLLIYMTYVFAFIYLVDDDSHKYVFVYGENIFFTIVPSEMFEKIIHVNHIIANKNFIYVLNLTSFSYFIIILNVSLQV